MQGSDEQMLMWSIELRCASLAVHDSSAEGRGGGQNASTAQAHAVRIRSTHLMSQSLLMNAQSVTSV